VSVTVRGVVAGVAVALVVAAVGVGVYVVGSPAEERVRRLDDRRSQDLGNIAQQVRMFAEQNKRLPDSLQQVPALQDESSRDPVTGRPYGYRITGTDTFEICADFDRASDPERFHFTDNTWTHGAGHTCFPQVATALRQLKR